MNSNQDIILQQLQNMDKKIDALVREIHNTNVEMTKIGGMKHALNDLKNWKEGVNNIVNPEDLKGMKKTIQQLKTATEDISRMEMEINSLKTFETKAKTAIGIMFGLFTLAVTVVGWFLT